MNRILPVLLATITRHQRYQVTAGVDFEWSSKSWVHNVFRVYELLFGRRYGIRREMSAEAFDGKIYYIARSWEASFALIEQYVREFLREWKFEVVKIYIPVLQPIGGHVTRSPYVFAIARDTAHVEADNSANNANPISFSFTCTGSNRILMTFGFMGTAGAITISSTYNSVSLVNTANSPYKPANGYNYTTAFLAGPSTGANTINITPSSAKTFAGSCASYTGASQTGIPDASTTNSNASGTSLTTSLTTIADNCWTLLCLHSNTDVMSASTGTTLFGPAANIGDSNASLTPAGLKSMSTTVATSGDENHMMNSIAPVGAGAAATKFLPLLGAGS